MDQMPFLCGFSRHFRLQQVDCEEDEEDEGEGEGEGIREGGERAERKTNGARSWQGSASVSSAFHPRFIPRHCAQRLFAAVPN